MYNFNYEAIKNWDLSFFTSAVFIYYGIKKNSKNIISKYGLSCNAVVKYQQPYFK